MFATSLDRALLVVLPQVYLFLLAYASCRVRTLVLYSVVARPLKSGSVFTLPNALLDTANKGRWMPSSIHAIFSANVLNVKVFLSCAYTPRASGSQLLDKWLVFEGSD